MKVVVGGRYGRLEAVGFVRKGTIQLSPTWMFCCDCGKIVLLPKGRVAKGNTKSCGCLRHDALVYRNKTAVFNRGTHGHSHKRTYNIWLGMKKRCDNDKCNNYYNYGARGITYCKEWVSFENFYADMGDAPEKFTLERIDGTKNYEKSNCKWATHKEQNNNKRNNHVVEFGCFIANIQTWCDAFAMKRSSVDHKMRKGATALQAIKETMGI